MSSLIAAELVVQLTSLLRGHKVMLGAGLVELYGVTALSSRFAGG